MVPYALKTPERYSVISRGGGSDSPMLPCGPSTTASSASAGESPSPQANSILKFGLNRIHLYLCGVGMKSICVIPQDSDSPGLLYLKTGNSFLCTQSLERMPGFHTAKFSSYLWTARGNSWGKADCEQSRWKRGGGSHSPTPPLCFQLVGQVHSFSQVPTRV